MKHSNLNRILLALVLGLGVTWFMACQGGASKTAGESDAGPTTGTTTMEQSKSPADEPGDQPEANTTETGKEKESMQQNEQQNAQASETDSNLPKGTYAVFETSLGDFTARLFTEKMPITTKNFIDLAEGRQEFFDPQAGQMVKRPLYNGRKIFRVIKGFMFQTGSANDSAAYDAGYTIKDEFDPSLKYDKPGLLAMANAGPNTGSTQFFVTFSGENCRHLQGKHPIFGEVVEGMDTVRKVEDLKTSGPYDMPIEMPTINKVTIKRVQ